MTHVTLVRIFLAPLIAFNLFFFNLAFADQKCENPDTLVFSSIPSEKATLNREAFSLLIDHLHIVTGKKIDFALSTSNASVLEAMMHGHVDIARLGPYMYVISQEKAKDSVEVFATHIMRKGTVQPEGRGYHSVLITKKNSKFTSIQSLKGTVLSLMDPGSTSGSLVPEVVFTKQEINGTPLRSYFSKIFYSGGQDLSTFAVYEGKADAAFVSSQILDKVLKTRGWEDEFNYLWFSPVLPVDSWVYNKKLCSEIKDKIAEAFMSFDEVKGADEYFKGIGAIKYVPAKDSDYSLIKELYEIKQKQKGQ